MLTESDVILAVCDYLAAHGFIITSRCTETQRGIDILAARPIDRAEVRIEAKGETSSKPKTMRYGKPFSSDQVLDHVSKAVYCAATYVADGTHAAVAFPKNAEHIKRVQAIASILKRLEIEVFWVDSNRKVEVVGNWTTWMH